MPNRAFLDSNVFIFAFERPGSNSEKIVSWLVNGELTGTVTDRVVREVMRYFRRYYGKDLAAKFRDIILLTCEFILEEDLTIPQTSIGSSATTRSVCGRKRPALNRPAARTSHTAC